VVREASTLSVELCNSTRINLLAMPWLLRWLYSQADAIVAPSNGVADDLSAVTGLQRNSLRVIYNPVVSRSMLSKAQETPDHSWLKSSQLPVILGIGRLSKQKDFGTLIQAFAQVRRQLKSRLVILGEGELRSELERIACNEGVQEDVSLPGFVRNPYPFFKNAKVFALSSRWEGLPNALIEALACGTPVVSTNCPHGPAEILADGRFGQLVPVGDVTAMAKALLKVLAGTFVPDDPKGHMSKFDAETNIDAYLQMLSGFINR
jgi:glycosyltransferase involved in cell wall biosynthesis